MLFDHPGGKGGGREGQEGYLLLAFEMKLRYHAGTRDQTEIGSLGKPQNI